MNEDWSIKLLVGDGDVANYNQFELVFNQGSNTKYKLSQGQGIITGQQPIALNHVSDDNAPVHARLVESNKFGQFELSVYDDDNATPEWDTILNNIHTLNRHMSGADSTAARYNVYGTAQKVRLSVTPDGATNTTYFEIQSGYADVSKAYYNAESQRGTDVPSTSDIGAWFIPIYFTFKTGGEGDSFTLRNDLASSPHFIEDSNSDGLADGWNTVVGATHSLSTGTYVIGGQSQVTNGTTAGDGIQSDSVTISGATSVVAFIAVNLQTTTSLNVILRDDVASIQTKTVTPANIAAAAYRTHTDINGNVWYFISLAGTSDGAATEVYIRLTISNTAAQRFDIDAAYLQTGTTTIPDGWCSSSTLKNRYDPTVSEANINYLDIWGIPGDLPAWANLTVEETSTGGGQKILTSSRYNVVPGETFITNHYEDSDQFSALFGAGTWSTGTGTIDNHYFRCTTTTGTITSLLGNSAFYSRRNWRLYGICRADTLTAGLTMKVVTRQLSGFPPSIMRTWYTSETRNVTTVSTWELIDFGLFATPPVTKSGAYDIEFDVSSNTGNVDFDGVLFFATVEGDDFIIIDNGLQYTGTTISGWVIDAPNKIVSGAASSNIGALWTVPPGPELSRTIFAVAATNDLIDITEEYTFDLTIYPRASHLLGDL